MVMAVIAGFEDGRAIAAVVRDLRPRVDEVVWRSSRIGDIDPLFRTTFLVLIFATFCMMQRGTIFNSMVPLFAGTELGYSATRIGSLFGVVGLVNALMILPSGFISDTEKGRVRPEVFHYGDEPLVVAWARAESLYWPG